MSLEDPHTDGNAHTSVTSTDSNQTASHSGDQDQDTSVIAIAPHQAGDQICQDQTVRISDGARKHLRKPEVRPPNSVVERLEPLETRSLAGTLARDVSAMVVPAAILGFCVRWAVKRMDPNYAAEQRVRIRRHRRHNLPCWKLSRKSI